MGRHAIHKAGSGFFGPRACHIGQGQSLPGDLGRDASMRLGWACLFYAFAYFMAYFGNTITHHWDDGPWRILFVDIHSIIAWVSILMALLLFYLTRCGRVDTGRLLDLGLVFMVVGAAGIAVNTFWGIFPDGQPSTEGRNNFMGVPWEAVWIVVYPVIAPATPRRILVAALLAASTGPAAIFLSRAAGATSGDVGTWFIWRYFLFTNYICVVLSVLTAGIIHKLGLHLRRARAMGAYSLIEKLGQGGMGEVWRAEHHLLARPAAVKLIKTEALGSGSSNAGDVEARFEREAQATASLQSPHTVRLYDFGRTDDGTFFYAMELLVGISLQDLVLKYGPQPPERVVPILLQICHSLHDAHRSDLVHRDIKPGNILLCRVGQDVDYVKVLDFGLVKSTRRSRQEDMQTTQAGVTPGTPAYLSPEKILGPGDIDGRSDIYSLGCVAYWLLTGRLVFEGVNSLEVAAQHLKDEPVPASQCSEFAIARELDEIIDDCLAKEPADRPAVAEALADRLRALPLDDGWTQDEARRWWQLNNPCRTERAGIG